MILHHDMESVDVDEEQIKLMRAYHLWVQTVRQETGSEDWEPSEPDIQKSRLFWRIRAGYLPLPWAPPRAYSCPWYEVVEDMGNHACFECHRSRRFDPPNTWVVAQCAYKHIEDRGVDEYIVGYGEYRFLIFRDVEQYARQIAVQNPHVENAAQIMLERTKNTPSQGWFIRRTPEFEIPQPEIKLTAYTRQLKPHMSTPLE